MIKKLILTSIFTAAMAHGSAESTLFTDMHPTSKETNTYSVWKPSMAKKTAGDSCKNGNCVSDLHCFTKNGKGYKFFRKLSKKIKKQCEKL